MTKHSEMEPRGLSRRAMLGRLSATGFLALGGPVLTFSQAHAAKKCVRWSAPDSMGQTLRPRPAGDGVSMIETQCLPDHAIGPYFANDAVPQPTAMQFYVPAQPKGEQLPVLVGDRIFGVAVNGVPFESIAPRYGSAAEWEYNVLSPDVRPYMGFDANNGHVHSNGQYHYVGSPLGLVCSKLDRVKDNNSGATSMLLLGWAADGFPIYADVSRGPLVDDGTPLAHTVLRTSYRLRSGRRPEGSPGGVFDGTFAQDYVFVQGAGDLDECNGRFGATPDYPAGTYYYVITRQFPYLPLAFRGKPDSSFTTISGPMSLPARLAGYTGRPIAADVDVPRNPESDALLLGMPTGLANAQEPLVMDCAGYRYFLAISSLDGKLYYSSISIGVSGQTVSPWQIVPQQAGFATSRPNLTMLSADRFQVSIPAQAETTKLTVSTTGSLDHGMIDFDAWGSAR